MSSWLMGVVSQSWRAAAIARFAVQLGAGPLEAGGRGGEGAVQVLHSTLHSCCMVVLTTTLKPDMYYGF